MFEKHILHHGKPTHPTEVIPLRAGPLTAFYDDGDLRYIRYGGTELIRGLYAAVRDKNWGTVPADLDNVQIDQEADRFQITYHARHVDPSLDIDFEWGAVVEGRSDGTIRFEMNGKANSTFERNRIGFCVLHPMELAGQPVMIEHDDGSYEDGIFPKFIAPHQPFFNIRGIRHGAGKGAEVALHFEGEVFEMEDQRNWTDASYKTYCTPLGLPFPVTVHVGEEIRQAVTINVSGKADTTDTDDTPITVDATLGEPAPLPDIGFGIASHGQPLTDNEVEQLRALSLAHLRVDLRMNAQGGAQLNVAVKQALQLDTALLVAVHLTDNAEMELNALATNLRATNAPLDAFLIFHQGEKSVSSR